MPETVTDDLLETVVSESAAGRKCFAICIAPEKRLELWQELQRIMCYSEPPSAMPYAFTSIKVDGAGIGLIVNV